MSQPALTAQEVLNWNATTSDQWRKFLSEHPDILAISCDIASTKTVAEFMQHIVAAELRYAERILRIPETPFEEIPCDSVEVLYATHDRATALYKQALSAGTDWSRPIEFQTRSHGTLRATAKTIYFHALLHSIRHYAQLGTLVRLHGHKPAIPGDYLFMGVERI